MRLQTIVLILTLSTLILTACSPEQEEAFREEYEDEVRQEVENIATSKNCRQLNGFLCEPTDDCPGKWLNSTESYCCSVQCNCQLENINDCKIKQEGELKEIIPPDFPEIDFTEEDIENKLDQARREYEPVLDELRNKHDELEAEREKIEQKEPRTQEDNKRYDEKKTKNLFIFHIYNK